MATKIANSLPLVVKMLHPKNQLTRPINIGDMLKNRKRVPPTNQPTDGTTDRHSKV